jgi:Xaa-Pro aminopeptidase
VEEAPPVPGGDDRPMLTFRTLTWVPFDRSLIVKEILSEVERNWADSYHAAVFEKIAPRVEGDSLAWLKAACNPL